MQFPKIISVQAIQAYTLYVVFTDGVKGNYDLSHLAGKGVFKTWDDENNFYKVFTDTDSGAICWPGQLDIDTIQVYCSVKNISVDSYLKQEQHASH